MKTHSYKEAKFKCEDCRFVGKPQLKSLFKINKDRKQKMIAPRTSHITIAARPFFHSKKSTLTDVNITYL